MKKRLIRLLFCAGLLIGLLTVGAAAGYSGTPAQPSGAGTAESPYQIGSAEELYWFAGLVNGTLTDGTTQNTGADAVLTADITINGNVLNTDGTLNGTPQYQWTPIGSDENNAYTGTFDGCGHTISGLYYYNDAVSDVGLFGYVRDGTVKNVMVADSYFSGGGTVGGICGSNNGGTIMYCSNSGTVKGSDNVGGVCGSNSGRRVLGAQYVSTITYCSNSGTVEGGDNVGGISGYRGYAMIAYCSNSGTVKGSNNVGGVCGKNLQVADPDPNAVLNFAISNCSNSGAVDGSENVGGVCGYVYYEGTVKSEIAYCFNVGGVTGDNYVGGVCGYVIAEETIVGNCFWLDTSCSHGVGYTDGNSNNTAEAKTAQEFASGAVTKLLCVEYVDPWRQKLGTDPYPVLDGSQNVVVQSGSDYINPVFDEEGFCVMERPETGGDGTGDSYITYYEPPMQRRDGFYPIDNAGQLYWFAQRVNIRDGGANAVLMNDITINTGVLAAVSSDDTTGLRAWTPIGGNNYNAYTGTFDGCGHTISGLYCSIEKSSTEGVVIDAGLFGDVQGMVRDLSITDSYVSVTAISDNSNSTVNIGGVCGRTTSGTIENCSSTGTVTGTVTATDARAYAYVGGVCGINTSGTLENCTHTGAVSGTTTTYGLTYVGGVCGYNAPVANESYVSTISNCTNTGAVSGTAMDTANVGGVCGNSYGTIKNCSSTGTVIGDDSSTVYVGGVCGMNENTIINCYWLDTAYSGDGIGNGSGEATKKTAEEFASGEVTWLLNEPQTDGPWRQKLSEGGDPFPTLDANGEQVVRLMDGDNLIGYFNAATLPAPGEHRAFFNTANEHVDPEIYAFSAGETIYVKDAVWGTIVYGNGTPDTLYVFAHDAADKTVPLPSTPARTGYTFGGWSDGSTTYGAGQEATITADTTFTAQWTANSYTVTFDANGGAGTMDAQPFTYDTPQALAANAFTRSGYTFAGWNTKADGSGDSYADGVELTLTDNLTLYAQWTANTYTVTFEANGGTGTMDAQPFTYDTPQTLTANAFTRSGYTFAGWNTKADGSGTGYSDGQTVSNLTTTPGGTVTLYAQWTANPTSGGGGSTPTRTPSQQAIDKIKAAQDGETVEITLRPGQTKLDKEVFETLAGRDVTLVIHLKDEVDWTIEGQDIAADAVLTDLDMGVAMNTSTIPVDLINALTGETGTVQLTLAHDGEFGFTLTLTAPLGAEHKNLWANLYHYDERAGTMTFQTAAQVDKDGNVALRFTHASQYAIVLDDKSHQLPFTDVPEGVWYVDAVAYVYRHDLMDGVGSNLFAPNATLNRAMAVTILYRLEGSPAVTTDAGFNDVAAGQWYTDAVNWAAANNIVNGVEGNNFDPTGSLTREQMATVLYRYAQYKGADVSASGDISGFADSANVSSWAADAVKWAVGTDLVNGVEGNALAPQGTSTRAQAATVLMRFVG